MTVIVDPIGALRRLSLRRTVGRPVEQLGCKLRAGMSTVRHLLQVPVEMRANALDKVAEYIAYPPESAASFVVPCHAEKHGERQTAWRGTRAEVTLPIAEKRA